MRTQFRQQGRMVQKEPHGPFEGELVQILHHHQDWPSGVRTDLLNQPVGAGDQFEEPKLRPLPDHTPGAALGLDPPLQLKGQEVQRRLGRGLPGWADHLLLHDLVSEPPVQVLQHPNAHQPPLAAFEDAFIRGLLEQTQGDGKDEIHISEVGEIQDLQHREVDDEEPAFQEARQAVELGALAAPPMAGEEHLHRLVHGLQIGLQLVGWHIRPLDIVGGQRLPR